MHTFTVGGVPVDSNYTPVLVTPQPQALMATEPQSQTLLDLSFETNPLDGSCDQRVRLGARPLDIIYDAVSLSYLICSHGLCLYANVQNLKYVFRYFTLLLPIFLFFYFIFLFLFVTGNDQCSGVFLQTS